MKRWKKWAIAGAIVLSIGASVYIYASARSHDIIDVKAVMVKRGNIESDLSCSGVTQTQNRMDYYASSPLKIEKIYVCLGDRVKVNELLAKFEPQDFSSELEQAYAQLEIASSTLEGLEKQKREGNEKTPSVIAGFDMGANKSFDIDSQIEIQKKQVELAKIGVDSIKDKIEGMQTEIKSSMAGVVTAINGAQGGIASVVLPIVSVEDTENIKAVINVSQYDAANIKEGQEAVVSLGDGGKEYKGIVKRISPTARKAASGAGTETAVPVDIVLKNPDSGIKIGYGIDVNIKTCFRANVLYIPNEAVISSKGRNKNVYAVQDGKALIKTIKTGVESDFYTEVIEGLSEGEYVIVNPPQTIEDGSFIRVSK